MLTGLTHARVGLYRNWN